MIIKELIMFKYKFVLILFSIGALYIMGRFLPANSPLLRGAFVLIILFVSVYSLYYTLKNSISLENKNQIIIVDKVGESGESHSFKKITSRSGFFASSVTDVDIYFNERALCIVYPNQEKSIYNLSRILELKRTDVRIGNNNVWRIIVKGEDKDITFKFTHNVRLWNKNFVEFHELLSSLNPEAVKTKWNYLRM